MITNTVDHAQAEQELRELQKRQEWLQESYPIDSKGFAKAGIRKMVARLHKELALDVPWDAH